jgi:hypothetical protein
MVMQRGQEPMGRPAPQDHVEYRTAVPRDLDEAVQDLLHSLAKRRGVRRVTQRQAVEEALRLLVHHYTEEWPPGGSQ